VFFFELSKHLSQVIVEIPVHPHPEVNLVFFRVPWENPEITAISREVNLYGVTVKAIRIFYGFLVGLPDESFFEVQLPFHHTGASGAVDDYVALEVVDGLYLVICFDDRSLFLCFTGKLADELLSIEDKCRTWWSSRDVVMFPYRDLCLKDGVKNTFSKRLPLTPFAFDGVCLPASSPLMVVSDCFVFLMDNNLDVWVIGFYRGCRA
jgi:hypothetical protein